MGTLRYLRIIGILLLGLYLVPAVAAQPQSSWPYERYLQLVGQLQTQAEAAQGQSAAGCTQTLAEIATVLESITQVQLPDGVTMPVRHDGATAVLRQSPCNPEWAIRYLSGICPRHTCPAATAPVSDLLSEMPNFSVPNPDAAGTDPDAAPADPNPLPDTAVTPPTNGSDSPPDAPTPPAADLSETADDPTTEEPIDDPADPADPTDAADTGETADTGEAPDDGSADPPDEAAAAETATDESTTTNDGAETAVATATQTAAAVSPAETDPEEATPEPGIFSSGLFWLAMAGLLLIVGALAWLLWDDVAAANKPPPRRQIAPSDPTAVLQEGRQQLREGDYRRAVRQLFLATLLLLEERGDVPPDRALTNHELLQEIQERPSLTTALAPVVDTFERVWYGFESLAAPEYERLVAHVEQIKGGQPQ
jgi:hypothetical protein